MSLDAILVGRRISQIYILIGSYIRPKYSDLSE